MILIYETSVTRYAGFDGVIDKHVDGIEAICIDKIEHIESLISYSKHKDVMLLVSIRTRSLLANLGVYPALRLNDAPHPYTAQALLASGVDCYLNRSGFLLPFNAISGHPSVSDILFLKSDSGRKAIPGQVIRKQDIDVIRQTYRFDQYALCLIAPAVGIICEVRYWVGVDDFGDTTILTRAPYAHDDQAINEDFVAVIENHADSCTRSVCSRLQSCSVMVVDLALTEDMQVKVVEINSVNTSGTYGAASSVVRNVASFLQSNRARGHPAC